MQRQQDEYEDLQNGADTRLFDEYGAAIFAYIRLHALSREDAEDLTHEVFTIAIARHNLEDFIETDKLVWLRRVAHNKLVDNYRRLIHHPVVALEEVEETRYQDNSLTPEQMALQHEASRYLHQALNRLTTLQQNLLHLRYGNGLRFAEIAILLDKREAALRKLLSRTLNTLRAIYEQDQQGDEI